jgi:hypothetical protein
MAPGLVNDPKGWIPKLDFSTAVDEMEDKLQ